MRLLKYFIAILSISLLNFKTYAIDSLLLKCYQNAYFKINSNLKHEGSINFESSIYEIENAYYQDTLSKYNFTNTINFHTERIKQLAEANKHRIKNINEQPLSIETLNQEEVQKANYKVLLNWAIYKYITDTTFWKQDVTLSGIEAYVPQYPILYEKEDPFGENNWETTMLTNILNPQKANGNCYSMAVLYYIFSLRLQSEAYLTTAPHHIFIQHKGFNGDFFNIELTTHSFPGSGTIKAQTSTSHEAVSAGVAMRRLSEKDAMALSLVYLAKGLEHSLTDSIGEKENDFILLCAETALQQDSLCLNAMLLAAQALKRKIDWQKKTDLIKEQSENIITQEINQSTKSAKRYEKRQSIKKNIQKNTKLPQEYKSFAIAAVKLEHMLSHEKNISIKNAYYIMESSWGNCYLSPREYNSQIKASADFIKRWLIQNELDLNSNLALCYGLIHFFEDTLVIKHKGYSEAHLPMDYDYVDYKAKEDYRNNFITKALATGWGQCNTLPAIYIILAEELKAKAWLSYAPFHSFIKFLDDEGNIKNYDPASKMFINDNLYQDYLAIGADAERNKIYLDTLSKQKVVAACLIDLAYMYLLKTNFTDMENAEAWVDYALEFYPNQANIMAWFIKSNIAVNQLQSQMPNYGISDIDQVSAIPNLEPLYNNYLTAENKIKEIGYRNINKNQYVQMMQQHQLKEQEQLNVDSKAKQKNKLFLQK